MVTFKNLSRFYARNSNGKWQLDVNEIRDAFIASGSVEEKMRSTRLTRILSIGSGETAFRIVDRPKLVTHVMPLERFQNPRNVDGSQLNAAHHALTVPSGNVADLRYNLDGCAGRGRDLMGESFDAIQFFRRGYVEVIDASNSAKAYAEYGFSTLPISKIHLRLFNSIACANAVLMASQLAPPYFVWVTLLGVKNCAIPHWGHGFFSGMPYIQQDSVLLTELMLETVPAEPSQIAKAARPILDELWQASGHPHCPYYDEKGEYFDPERRY